MDEKKYLVNEIFYSLQGEGHNTGTPAVFVRFSKCNLACPFCDTDHYEGRPMTADEIIEAVEMWPDVELLVLTGGEPMLQVDDALVEQIHACTIKRVAVETNGTCHIPNGIDWVTVSPKDAEVVLDHADEIKVVDCGQALEPYLNMKCYTPGTYLYLQPCYVPDSKLNEANLRSTIGRVLDNPQWRLSLQTHRLINIK